MISWLGAAVGLSAGFVGTTVAVSAAAVSRLELARWISRRLRGAAVASTLFSAPGPILRGATALASLGVLVAGVTVAPVLAPMSPWTPFIVGVAIPGLAAVIYGCARAVGRHAPEAIVQRATPWARRLSIVRPFLPAARQEDVDFTQVLLAAELGPDMAPEEERLIAGVLTFTSRLARDVMTSRTEVVALPEGAPLDEVARLFIESGYSRLPVHRESLDNIIGMIYAFDLLKVTPGGELPLRPVLATPGSKECSALLLDLQRERRQLAVVLDEFGGTAGIVTLEDLLEELVGEIFDDDEVVVDGGTEADLAEYHGAASCGEVASRFGVQLPEGAETIGGLIAHQAGRIPQPGERLVYNGLEFDVLSASPTKVERIVVRRGPVRAVNIAHWRSSNEERA